MSPKVNLEIAFPQPRDSCSMSKTAHPRGVLFPLSPTRAVKDSLTRQDICRIHHVFPQTKKYAKEIAHERESRNWFR